MKVFHRCI